MSDKQSVNANVDSNASKQSESGSMTDNDSTISGSDGIANNAKTIDSNNDNVESKHDWIYAFTEKLNHAVAVLIAITCGVIVGFIVFVFASHGSATVKAVNDYINGNMMIIRVIIGIIGAWLISRAVIGLGMIQMISDYNDNKTESSKSKYASDFISTVMLVIMMLIIAGVMLAFAFIGGIVLFTSCLAIIGVVILIYAVILIIGRIRDIRNANVDKIAVNKNDSNITVNKDSE